MDNVANVGFIDAHAKGYGRDNGIDIFSHEIILVSLSVFVGHAGVVGGDSVSFGKQLGTHLFHVRAADAIDNAGFVLMAIEDVGDLFEEIDPWFDLVYEVGPVEGADEHVGIFEVELIGDILANLLRGGGGISVHRDTREGFFEG